MSISKDVDIETRPQKTVNCPVVRFGKVQD
jgi:hypothetical protein